MSLIYNSYFNDFFNDNYNNVVLRRKDKNENFKNSIDTKCNIYKKEDSFIFNLYLPGFSKDDFKIDIENGVLTVSGELNLDNKDYIHQEYSQLTKFKRSFSLPDNINIERVDANYESGILKVSIPVLEERKVISKRVTIR